MTIMDVPKQVLACLIEDGGSLTVEQIAEELGLSVGEVEDALLELQVRKRVKRHEPEADGEPTYRTMIRKDARSPAVTPVVTRAPEPCKDPPVPRPKPLRERVHCPVPGCKFTSPTTQGIRVHITRTHSKEAVPKDHSDPEAPVKNAVDHSEVNADQEDLPNQNAQSSIDTNAGQADRQEETEKHHPIEIDRIIQAFQVLRSVDPVASARVVVPLQDGTRVMLTLCREED